MEPQDEARQSRNPGKSALDILVGIEAGVLGGLLMIAWFAVSMPVLAKPWWLVLNLLGAGLYGDRYVWYGPGMITCFGSALHIVGAGLVGAINGVLTPGGRLFGLAMAGLWYLLCYVFVWKRIAPGLLLHTPQAVLIAGWFLYGSVLGWHAHLVARTRS